MKPWIIVPAAGIGRRFAAPTPKQYQRVLGKTVLELTLERLLALQPQEILVAVNPQDNNWRQLPLVQAEPVQVVQGGATRAESVLAGLLALGGRAGQNDWVLVHDVARPCVRVEDMQCLCESLENHPVGGILAAPLSDTIKRVGDNTVVATVDRASLWAALTPQVFRFGLLKQSLQQGLEQRREITDEASALELAGHTPAIVPGNRDNIKITHNEDLALAEAILRYQAGHCGEQL